MTPQRRIRGVIVIVADQLNARLLGFTGNSIVSTPHLDRLAARSMRFSNASVANPTCMPNRAAIATGRMPSATGSRTNGIPLEPSAATFMGTLHQAGWSTSAAGKLHFQNMEWPFEAHEIADIERTNPLLLDPRISDSRPVDRPSGWDGWESIPAHRARWIDMPTPYYGFDHVDLVVGHGDRPSGQYCHWAAARGVDLGSLGGYQNAEIKMASWDEVWKSRVPAEAHPTTYVKEHVVGQLRAAAATDRPFLVYGSFPDPHHPFCPPDPYWSMYRPDDVELPATFGAEHHAPPAHVAELLQRRGVPGHATALWAPNEEQMRAVLAAQYAQVTFIDDAIGAILDEVALLGLDDEVAIVFTTDHGDMMGEHGLLLKQTAQYRAVTQVPLLLAAPGVAAVDDDRLAQSIDIAPTVLALAAAEPYLDIQGANLLVGAPHRDAVLIEEEYPFGFVGLSAPITIRSVVSKRGRLTLYPGQGFGELYDHVEDPDELANRFDDPGAAVLRAEMHELLAELMVNFADRGRAPTASA